MYSYKWSWLTVVELSIVNTDVEVILQLSGNLVNPFFSQPLFPCAIKPWVNEVVQNDFHFLKKVDGYLI